MGDADSTRSSTVRATRSVSRGASLLAALALVAGVSSCSLVPADEATTAPIAPTESSAPTTPTAQPSAEPEPDPEFVDGGTAEQNKPYFDFVASAIVADGNPGGRAIIDGLASAGFEKSSMQVTADRTPLGNAVDSLQFSVEFDDGCLIGQAGGGKFTSILAPALESGGCLLGDTRSIDW